MAHLGMRILEVAAERVVGELEIGEHLKTTTGAVHGGTLMAFADTIGAVGTSAMGLKTATLESKTNFFAAATAGKLRAESTASRWRTRAPITSTLRAVRAACGRWSRCGRVPRSSERFSRRRPCAGAS